MTEITNNKLLCYILLAVTLPLCGCDTAANPFYSRHPQKSQSFAERRVVKDNNFISSGGLSKKYEVDPFINQNSIPLTSRAYEGADVINQTSIKYKDPLPFDPKVNKAKNEPYRRGQQSSIMDFFRSLSQSTKEVSTKYYNTFIDEAEQGKDAALNYISPSNNQKRVPNGNSQANTSSYAADEQGNSSIGYSHYETAQNVESYRRRLVKNNPRS